jgi:rhamnogalacturonyl hydrolase YesR
MRDLSMENFMKLSNKLFLKFMTRNVKIIFALFLIAIFFTNCSASSKISNDKWFEQAIKRSEQQLNLATIAFKDSCKNPRSYEKGKVHLVNEKDWTSGFFPGSLWYLYELTGNREVRKEAEYFTEILDKAQYRTNTHDLGFIIQCSYGNGYRLTGNEAYKKVMFTGANSLMQRYNPKIGLIKSWDWGNWQYPVIIDNMMNLEFLCNVAILSGDESFKLAAISHANKTIENHFRNDYSCFHVVNYDSITGKVLSKGTHQGYSNSSSWVRGQAWALYGYTMMYRFTNNESYLKQAEHVASFILKHPRLPADKIPYWDFDVPDTSNIPHDASAAAIIASALLELSVYVNKSSTYYFDIAEIILRNLSTDEYLAQEGENGFFILKHSTGHFPAKSEVDTPLSYADYYYLEALKRYKTLKKNSLCRDSVRTKKFLK